MKVEFYKDGKGEWRWRLRARNGRTVADSGEGYKRKGACVRSFYGIVTGLTTKRLKVEWLA